MNMKFYNHYVILIGYKLLLVSGLVLNPLKLLKLKLLFS
jgi:hypothetical protein